MKIYTDKISCEMLCTKEELDILIDYLLKFQDELNQYIENNKDKPELGYSHLHLQDNHKIKLEDGADVVFYIHLENTSE